MKDLPLKKTLLFFLLISAQAALAQGTENALEALGIFMMLISCISLLAVLVLIIFLINRGKIAAVVSAIFGILLLLTGFFIAMPVANYYDAVVSTLAAAFIAAGSANLLLVFSLVYIFPRQQKNNGLPENTTAGSARDNHIVRWLSVFLCAWFFYYFYAAFESWVRLMRDNEFRYIAAVEIYFALVELLFLILLPTTLILLMKGRRVGWQLLMFFSLYSVVAQLIYMYHNLFSPQFSKFEMPLYIWIIQTVHVIFFTLCIVLLMKENVRDLYGISKRSSTKSLLICLLIACFILVINNTAFL